MHFNLNAPDSIDEIKALRPPRESMTKAGALLEFLTNKTK